MEAPTSAQMIEAYLKLRNKVNEIKQAYKNKLQPYNDMMGQLEAQLMARIDKEEGKSFKCEHGTAFTQVETSVTVENWSETLEYIRSNAAWELLEARVAKGGALAVIAETKNPVPGVKVTQTRVLRVRTA